MARPTMHDSRSPRPPDSVIGVDALVVHGSQASQLIRAYDWSKTTLGPIRHWPRSLLSLVGIMLHSRHPMFLWWGEELVQLYNDAYVPSFGRGKHPEAMGQRGRDCWQEIWPIIGPQIEGVMRRGEATWHEDALVPIERNGGIEEVYWTYGYSPAFDDAGNVAGTLVVCTETTARVLGARRTETMRKLGERLASCSAQQEVVPAMFEVLQGAALDVPYFASISREEAAALGLSSSAAVSEQLVTLEPPRPCTAWPQPVTQALALPYLQQSSFLLLGVSPRLSFDDAYRSFFRQILEELNQAQARIEAFRARAAAESERRNLIMQAPIAAAVLTGPRHVYELTNPAYVEVIGGQQVIGKAYVEAFPDAANGDMEAIMSRVYQSGEPYTSPEYLVPPLQRGAATGDKYISLSLQPIRDAQGEIYGIMALALDITHQVNARHLVEKAAAEREKLLTQLEAAGHAKDEFLATVSHELRTPLTSILGWARLLEDAGNGDTARLHKGLAAIERNAKAQAKLIEDILDVSRIVSGKVRLSVRRVDPAAVVLGAVETVRPLASAKQQRLHLELPPDLPALNADEDRLQQVVWNLLSNAVKFTPEQGEIVVSARRQEDSVVVSVRDSGKGISSAFLPHVFDRFRQDDTSTTKQQAGLGLGLAIVRHLVELHGGTVTAFSDGPGTGSTFSVALPVRASTPHEEVGTLPPPDHAAGSGVSMLNRLRGVHALIVDDQDDARDLLATVLEDAGARVSQARSVDAALVLLANEPVDVVVSDIAMPDEDGYSFMRRLRAASAGGRQLPAVAVTAFARAEDRQRAIQSGFQDHISKPIDPATLVDVVATLVLR